MLTKIDEILTWEKRKEAERDTRFVELGRYLCEVRAGQYWRVENVKSFAGRHCERAGDKGGDTKEERRKRDGLDT